MKKIFIIALCLTSFLVMNDLAFAGNKDRSGEAGATELLINPWARSAGLGGFNTSTVTGVEAMRSNVGGLAFAPRTQFIISRSLWLSGSDININAAGLAVKAGDSGVFGLSLMTIDFGDINITTAENPEGGVGTYSPQWLNLGISYARIFSNSIHGGITLRSVTESIGDVRASGLAVDAGIQYVTGPKENIHFGISLRNVGTPLRFTGDGLAFSATAPAGEYPITASQRSEDYELPSLLHIGGAYDFNFGSLHKLTLLGNFTSNSFSQDQFGVGIEYGLKELFALRAGYRYETDITSADKSLNLYTGPSAGFSAGLPLGNAGTRLGIDYAFRLTARYAGTHTLGLRINLGGGEANDE